MQDTVDDLNEAEAQLKSVYYSLFKPYYEKLKILHGERANSSGDRATNKKINEALESNKEAFLRTRQKVAEIKAAVKAKQDEETSVASDLRHKLVDKQIDKQRVKAVSELKPQTLTRSFLPDRMREWKYDFEQWYDSSNFGSLKPSGQVSYFSQAIDPEVKTHLWQLKPKITLDQVKGDQVFLFPDQAKEAGVAEAHSLWNRLDLLYTQKFHPLTKIRFELLDGSKDPTESIEQLQERLTGAVQSARLDELTQENWVAILMLKSLNKSNQKIVKDVLAEAEKRRLIKGKTDELTPEDIMAEANAASVVTFLHGEDHSLNQMRSSGARSNQRSGKRSGSGSGSRGRGRSGSKSSNSVWGHLEGDKKRLAMLDKGVCLRCGKSHQGICRFEHTRCDKCGDKGHLAAVCFKTKEQLEELKAKNERAKNDSSNNGKRGKKRKSEVVVVKQPTHEQPGTSESDN